MLQELHVNWGTHRMKPTYSKSFAQSTSKTAGSHPKSPPKLNDTNVNIFKELSVISCFTCFSPKADNNLKPANYDQSSVVVQEAVNPEGISNAVPETVIGTSNSSQGDFNLMNDNPLSVVIQEIINPEGISNAVPETAIDPSTADCNLKLINDDQKSVLVQETIEPMAISNAVSKTVIDTSDLSQGNFNLMNDNHLSVLIKKTINPETILNAVPETEIDMIDPSIADCKLKLLNDDQTSVVVQETIKPRAISNAVSKTVIDTSDLSQGNFNLMNDNHLSVLIQETINPETILNAVPETEIDMIDPSIADCKLNLLNDDQTSVVVQETIKPAAISNAVPKTVIDTFNLPKAGNDFKPIDHFSSVVVQETSAYGTTSNALPKNKIDTSDFPRDDNNFTMLTNDHSSVQKKTKSETLLHAVPKNEIDTYSSSKGENHFFKPIFHSAVVVQGVVMPETPSNAVPNNETKKLLSTYQQEVLDSDNCSVNDSKINAAPTESSSNNEETLSKSGCKNVAFSIEFEPDNRYLVYEHHKVGLKKSPVIFRKRVSKSYESVKPFCDKDTDFKNIEMESNVTSESREPQENKNCLIVTNLTTDLNEAKKYGIESTETDILIKPSSEVSLSWRERVLEIMEVSDNSPINKNPNTFSCKSQNQNDLCSVPGLEKYKSHSEIVGKISTSDSNDKCTEVDNHFLINQELIDLFNSNNSILKNNTYNFSDNYDIIDDKKKLIEQSHSEEIAVFDKSDNSLEMIDIDKNVESNDEMESLPNINNDFIDVDVYFDEENIDEMGKLQHDNTSLDVDVYFVEENNVTNEVLGEEICTIEEIIENKQPAMKSNESDLLNDDKKNVNVITIVETNFPVEPIEFHSDNEVLNDNSPLMSDRCQVNEYLEESDVNQANKDNLEGTEMASHISFINEYENNGLFDLEEDENNNRSETFIKENDLIENSASSAPCIMTSKKLEKLEHRSVSDTELQIKHFKEKEVSRICKKGIGTTCEDEEYALNFRIIEREDSPTSVKDKILKLAGLEFVSMANRTEKCDASEGLQMNYDCETDSERNNIYCSAGNNPYPGSYKPNTYCLNTHTNTYKDRDKMYTDIFSHLKNSPEQKPKITTWQTMPDRSECDTLSEKDSLDSKYEEESGDEFYIFQPCPAYDDRAHFETETFNNPFKKFYTEGTRYNLSSSSSSYNSGEDKRNINKNRIIYQEPFTIDSPKLYTTNSKSSHSPLLKSRRNDFHKSNTLPPLFSDPKMASFKCDKTNNIKPDFPQNLKSDYYTHFPNIKNYNELSSDSDWDLSDCDAYEEKKTVLTRSSRTVYNRYYEHVEYSRESNDFQTIKTSVSNLPLPHGDYFKEKEFKLPKIQPKHVHIDQKFCKKKMTDFKKLPPLRNFKDCGCSSRKEKETDEDVENRNHKFLNNSIDSAYSRSSGAEGDTGKAEMSKFCHECGAKYPIAGAKFCCNCGMRRITL